MATPNPILPAAFIRITRDQSKINSHLIRKPPALGNAVRPRPNKVIRAIGLASHASVSEVAPAASCDP
jgi:hypothetical protein